MRVVKVIKFHDTSVDTIHYGLKFNDGTVACACCGALFTVNEVEQFFDILKEDSTDYLEETLKEFMEE